MASGTETLEIAFIIATGVSLLTNLVSISIKLCKDFTNPKLWKYSLIFQDVAHVFLCTGLILFYFDWKYFVKALCDAASFFLLFGIFEALFAVLTSAVILLGIQNPGKSSRLSRFHRKLVLLIVLPEICVGAALSVIRFAAYSDLEESYTFTIDCFPLRRRFEAATVYGTFMIGIWWLLFVIATVCNIISALKVWKFNNRITSAQNNVWQTQLIAQGKTFLKILGFEHIIWLSEQLLITVVLYTDEANSHNRYSWLVMTSLAVVTLLHGIISNAGNSMWSTCCCRGAGAVEEPQRKLKKLELLKIDAPGKLRMKATWNIGKGATKRGLMKVYGVSHLKAWAQEIVMLGMLRRAQHPSLIQCLWTSSSNPYYETMTLISGEIITSDSRIICLEMTNGGTLQEFLLKVELPLPEPCQRMIIHDVAEGLFYLHHQNILHSNLSSSCIYLKGSLQSMVLRAAVGDFEDAQVYGTLQQSADSSITDKTQFFLPDIRSFALIALEIVSKMCEKKFQNRYVNYDSENTPLKLNLADVISDDEEEFQNQYGYDAEDTYRMFDSVHPEAKPEIHHERRQGRSKVRDKHTEQDFQFGNRTDSLDNLMDKDRPTSPRYTGLAALPDGSMTFNVSDDEDDEVAKYSVPYRNKAEERALSPALGFQSPVEQRCKSPERCRSPTVEKPKLKGKKDKVNDSGKDSRTRSVNPKRAVSPLSVPKLDQDRGASPDPMQDAKLQELRSKAGTKQSRKDKGSAGSRKQKKEDAQGNGKAFEAFVSEDQKQSSKRKDSKWLSKPTSILKSITGSDNAVSVFKAKTADEDNYLDAIEEEEIDVPQSSMMTKSKNVKLKKTDSEVWNIIDEQYYKQVDKRAASKLKKTVSGESRSSLWSFISTPDDLDDDDKLDDIIECLPGMTDSGELRKSQFTVSEIMAEREKSFRKNDQRISIDGASKSKFELIDYYELLVQKKITMNDVPPDKREMLQNVVELKLEEHLRREERATKSAPIPKQGISHDVIKNDEMYDNAMTPGSNSGKIKVVSFRRNQQVSELGTKTAQDVHSPQQEFDPRRERARSAPLKRPRTPMHKPHETVTKPEVNPAFTESKTYVKRTRARTALKRALNKNGNHNGFRYERGRPDNDKPNLALKYATVKKLNPVHESGSSGTDSTAQDEGQVLRLPVPTSESFSVHVNQAPSKSTNIKRFSSFSSNESSSSFASSVRVRKADVSLTSGELTSLSSQAESDHFDTDGHTTDIEGPVGRQIHTTKRKFKSTSKVDSGFDSGSMSSEMSDAFVHSKQYYTPVQHSKNDSWARNYKMVDYIPNSPLNFSNKFMPPVDCLPEEQYPVDSMRPGSRPNSADVSKFIGNKDSHYAQEEFRDDDSGITETQDQQYEQSQYEDRGPTPKIIEVSSAKFGETLNLSQRAMSPTRPMSPERTMSPNRPFSANVFRQNNRPLSPLRPDVDRPKQLKSPTPKIHVELADPVHTKPSGQQSVQMASKRYRELVRQGVPLRASVIDSSPTRVSLSAPQNSPEQLDSERRPGTAESMEEGMDEEQLFATLDSKGFFRTKSPTPKSTNLVRSRTPVTVERSEKEKYVKKRKPKQVPLDQLVSETPLQGSSQEGGKSFPQKDPNRLSVSEDVFLNQPTTSEDSETCSIRTTKSTTSSPSGTKPKVVVDAELVIDRIFSQQNANDMSQLDVEVEAALGLDQDPFRAVNQMYYQDNPNDYPNLNTVPLLKGTSQKHVDDCVDLASNLHVVTVRDLLPAKLESFDILRNKLQQVGQLGIVGNQLMDIIQTCWLQDMPPTSGDLVEQLTDPVAETEV